MGPIQIYTRGDVAALPADDSDLETAFSDQDYDDVALDDGIRVAQTATGEYAVFLFKDKHTQQENIVRTWNGQSARAPSASPVVLQIYNRTGTTWETVDQNNSAAADTDFNLSASITTDLGDYFDAEFWVAFRLYQEAI